jgi:hypothetical protein
VIFLKMMVLVNMQATEHTRKCDDTQQADIG